MRDDFQDEVDLAVEHVALAHFGEATNVVLERAEGVLGLGFQRDHGEDGDRKAQFGGIEIGVIATDDAQFLQRADTAQAGGGGEADAAGQIDVGDPPFSLQLGEEPPVDLVKVSHLNRDAFRAF